MGSQRSAHPVDPRAVLSSAALAACVVGLLGVDAGLVWLVAGVWTVRSMAQAPVGAAWGIACLGAGLRWGTTSLGDIAVATRLSGPTVAAGSPVVRAGMIAALVGAVLSEASDGGLRAEGWFERAAAAIGIAVLIPLFVVRGPGDPRSALPLLWGGLAVAGTIAVLLLLRPVARLVPRPLPIILAGAGIVAAAALR